MPRNSTGTFNRVNNSFSEPVTDTIIADGDANSLFNDFDTALTDSLSRSGKGGMESALDMGAHQINNVSNPTAAQDAATKAYADAVVPPGVIWSFGGAAAPTGFLLCFGQAVSRTAFAALFAAISTTYGGGDGSTTFNIPDLRGRVPAGADAMGGSAASRLTSTYFGSTASPGAVGGNESETLTIAQAPSGIISGVTVNDTRTWQVLVSAAGLPDSGVNVGSGSSGTSTRGQAATVSSGLITASFTDNAGNTPHPIVQPTLITNYIIKT